MSRGYSIKDISQGVAKVCALTVAELYGPSVARRIARPRQIVFYLARELTIYSFPQLGRAFGKHHTTALSGDRLVRSLIAESEGFAQVVRQCREAIEARGPTMMYMRQAVAAEPLVAVPSPEREAA